MAIDPKYQDAEQENHYWNAKILRKLVVIHGVSLLLRGGNRLANSEIQSQHQFIWPWRKMHETITLRNSEFRILVRR